MIPQRTLSATVPLFWSNPATALRPPRPSMRARRLSTLSQVMIGHGEDRMKRPEDKEPKLLVVLRAICGCRYARTLSVLFSVLSLQTLERQPNQTNKLSINKPTIHAILIDPPTVIRAHTHTFPFFFKHGFMCVTFLSLFLIVSSPRALI